MFPFVIAVLFAGPAFWGLINPEWSLCNKGRRQSPVNLEPNKLLFDPNLRPLHIDKHRVRSLQSLRAPFALPDMCLLLQLTIIQTLQDGLSTFSGTYPWQHSLLFIKIQVVSEYILRWLKAYNSFQVWSDNL